MSKCTMASLKLAALKISAALAANSGSHALSSLHLAREASVAHHLDVVRRKFSKRARDKSGWCLLHTIFARQFFFGDCFQGHVGKGWRRRSCIRGMCGSGGFDPSSTSASISYRIQHQQYNTRHSSTFTIPIHQ
ncbi:hypothetical protein B0T12DRAFT_217722 [Alternaria alternata]|nr:hypothetical protein B0T12DRAFT_217722 [Alternaria alternata]